MMSAFAAGRCLPRCAASSFQNGCRLPLSSLTQSEFATPALSDHCLMSAQMPAASTTTVKLVLVAVVFPALSDAVAFSVFRPPANVYAGPAAPGHVEDARPEPGVGSAAAHVMLTVSVR